MKLFDFERAPNPRRVRMFLAEKGIELQLVPVDLFRYEQLTPQFLAINPGGTVPVLETDDGTYLCEAVAICDYLEALHPEIPMFGSTALERAQVLMWNNICENEGISAVAEVLRNWSPGFRGRAMPGPTGLDQIPSLIERGRARCNQFFDRIEARLDGRKWLAAAEYSFADITLLATVDFAAWVEIDPCAARPGLHAWYQRAANRPSARA